MSDAEADQVIDNLFKVIELKDVALKASEAKVQRLLVEIKMNTDKDFYEHCLGKVVK